MPNSISSQSAHPVIAAGDRAVADEAAAAVPAVAPRVGRTGIVFGLTGVFSFVLGSLILTRPEPLRAHPVDPTLAAVTARVDAALGPAATPAVLGIEPGTCRGLIVQHSTYEADADLAASPAIPHITITLDAPSGPVVRVVKGMVSGVMSDAPMLVAVTGNPAGDTVDWRDDPTVRLLVARLCEALKIDDRYVRWS